MKELTVNDLVFKPGLLITRCEIVGDKILFTLENGNTFYSKRTAVDRFDPIPLNNARILEVNWYGNGTPLTVRYWNPIYELGVMTIYNTNIS